MVLALNDDLAGDIGHYVVYFEVACNADSVGSGASDTAAHRFVAVGGANRVCQAAIFIDNDVGAFDGRAKRIYVFRVDPIDRFVSADIASVALWPRRAVLIMFEAIVRCGAIDGETFTLQGKIKRRAGETSQLGVATVTRLATAVFNPVAAILRQAANAIAPLAASDKAVAQIQ